MYSSYPAPSNLTTMNAVAEVASSADNPSSAASTCTQIPAPMPQDATNPARQPWLALRLMMSKLSGPGVIFSRKPERIKMDWVLSAL